MTKTTIIFNIILGLSCAAFLAGCGSPDEDPNAGAASGGEVRPEGMQNTPVTSKDGKDTVTVANGAVSQALPAESLGSAKKGGAK